MIDYYCKVVVVVRLLAVASVAFAVQEAAEAELVVVVTFLQYRSSTI